MFTFILCESSTEHLQIFQENITKVLISIMFVTILQIIKTSTRICVFIARFINNGIWIYLFWSQNIEIEKSKFNLKKILFSKIGASELFIFESMTKYFVVFVEIKYSACIWLPRYTYVIILKGNIMCMPY